MSEYKLKNARLFTLREDKNGKAKTIVFNKGVTIQYNGQDVDLGEYNTVFLKNLDELAADQAFKLGKGWTTEEKIEKENEFLTEKKVKAACDVKLK